MATVATSNKRVVIVITTTANGQCTTTITLCVVYVILITMPGRKDIDAVILHCVWYKWLYYYMGGKYIVTTMCVVRNIMHQIIGRHSTITQRLVNVLLSQYDWKMQCCCNVGSKCRYHCH